jgi:hypothetical protein
MKPDIQKRVSSRIRHHQISRGHQVCVWCFYESTMVAVLRCADCDREVCTHCAVTIAASSEHLCPECATERASEEE